MILNRVRTNDAGGYVLRASDAEGETDSPARTVLIGPTFTKLTNETVGTSGSGGIAWGDFNQDGWIDLFYTVRSSALTTLFTNNGHGGFVRTGGSIGANMLNPLGATWGDFDNNGALDLFIANNNGDGTFTHVNVGPMTSDVTRSFTQAWADINNDGFPDVLITGVYTPRSLQGNDGNDNAWLTVRCVDGRGRAQAGGSRCRRWRCKRCVPFAGCG